MAVVLTPVTG